MNQSPEKGPFVRNQLQQQPPEERPGWRSESCLPATLHPALSLPLRHSPTRGWAMPQ